MYVHLQKRTENMSNTSFRQRVIDMAVGETITIPVANVKYSTLRCYAYEVGLSENRRYSTHRDKATQTYAITRKS